MLGEAPGEFHIGLNYSLNDRISVLNNISTVLWEQTKSRDGSIKNQVEFSGSIVYEWTRALASSIGIFYTDYRGIDDVFNPQLTGYYLTFGLVYQANRIIVDGVIADGQLLSDDWRRQTIARIGISVQM